LYERVGYKDIIGFRVSYFGEATDEKDNVLVEGMTLVGAGVHSIGFSESSMREICFSFGSARLAEAAQWFLGRYTRDGEKVFKIGPLERQGEGTILH
jgi:hypothetical protein